MAATEALLSQLIRLCTTDFGVVERTGAIAELCFPSCDDYDIKDNSLFTWVPRVQTVPELKQKVKADFILDASQMHQVARYVLPKQLAFRRWQRIFSLARDGDNFDKCLKSLHGHRHTLMVIRTTRGEVFGGFADTPWDPHSYEYHGGQDTKLFSFTKRKRLSRHDKQDSDSGSGMSESESDELLAEPDSRDDSEEQNDKKQNDKKDPLYVYKWSGANRDFQYCDPGRSLIGLGGGGARFGLSIEQDFRYGSTGPCDTFHNEPLCNENNFRVLDVEIWGFIALEDPCCSYLCFQPTHVPEEDLNWIPPVRVVREPYCTENFILSPSQMNQIARYVLPQTIAACRWKRVYSLARDGDAFESCLHLIRKEHRSLLVIRTSENKVFGGYADSPWRAANSNYYGSAQACLWTFLANNTHDANINNKKSNDNTSGETQLKVFKWTGINRYIQYCDITHQILAFGGGGEAGSFGLCVEKEFQMGSTGPCATFGNAPLCNEEHFHIVDLEIWGFLTGHF